MMRKKESSERKNRVVAVIDLGSNSVRMTIAEIKEDHTVEELANYREMVRISAGLKETGKINIEAYERTAHALQKFCQRMRTFAVQEVIAIATEALRKAENREDFVWQMKAQTGICFQIIPGEEEARYDFLGVSEGREIQDCILLDTGGGSTEFMQIAEGKLKNVISLPLGGVVLTEEFLKHDPPTKEELEALQTYVQEQLQKAPWLRDCNHWPVFAIGGTNRALMKVMKKKEFLPDEIEELNAFFKTADLDARKQLLGEYKDRADIVVGGLAPLTHLITLISPARIFISEKGLRDGILYEMSQK